MKLFCLGDIHGSVHHLSLAIKMAQQNNCRTIWQVGDNGLCWMGKRQGLDRAEALLAAADMEMSYIDGNHEDFEAFYIDAKLPQIMTPHITYYPRGFCFDLDGAKVLTLGGSVSMDQDARVRYIDYFPQEEITEAQVRRAMDAGQVDIMFTHDTPYGMPDFEAKLALSEDMWSDRLLAKSRRSRQAIAAVVDVCKPRLLVGGHYHMRHSGFYNDTRVEILNCDGTYNQSWMFIETSDWKH